MFYFAYIDCQKSLIDFFLSTTRHILFDAQYVVIQNSKSQILKYNNSYHMYNILIKEYSF